MDLDHADSPYIARLAGSQPTCPGLAILNTPAPDPPPTALTQATAQSGAVPLIQRFGSALNLNIHFHLLVLDGAYVRGHDRLEFHRVPPPTKAELEQLLNTITTRVGRHLQRQGWLTRDVEGSQRTVDREGTALDRLLSHSISYRLAVGPRAGHKAFTLRSLPGTPLL